MKLIDLLWLLLPAEAMPLLMVLLATASILGLVRPARVVSILIIMACMPVISSVVEEIVALLPWPVSIVILLALATNVLRLILELFLGKEAAGHVLGHIVLGVARILGLALVLPIRMVFRLARPPAP